MSAHSKKQVFKILKTEKSNDRTVWPCKGFSKGITSHFSLHDEYRNKQQNKTLIHTLFSALLSTLLFPGFPIDFSGIFRCRTLVWTMTLLSLSDIHDQYDLVLPRYPQLSVHTAITMCLFFQLPKLT